MVKGTRNYGTFSTMYKSCETANRTFSCAFDRTRTYQSWAPASGSSGHVLRDRSSRHVQCYRDHRVVPLCVNVHSHKSRTYIVAFAPIISRLKAVQKRGRAVLHEAESVDWIVLVLRAMRQPCNGRAARPYCLLPFYQRITDTPDLDGSVYCAPNDESFFRC